MMKNKVLIVSNPLNHEGGIVNYYNLLFKHFKSNEFELQHFSNGSRAYLFYYPILKRILYPFYFIFDYFRFVCILIFNSRVKIVQLNPSLIPLPLLRDGLLLITAKILRKKTIVFYRGWKLHVFNRLCSTKILKNAFNCLYQKGTQQIVLSTAFKNDLQCIGRPTYPVSIFKTAIDKNDIIIENYDKSDVMNVLFLGRVQNLKGIEELIDAIIQLHEKNELKCFKFTIVGHEEKAGYIEILKDKLAIINGIDFNVTFTGRITGNDKFRIYSLNETFILPSYTEGCPNSVIEALASGLFCITTKVGAMPDIIEDGKNGLLIEEKSSDAIVEALLYCYKHKSEIENVRVQNARMYSERFDIKNTVLAFNNIYSRLLNEK
jgi:glycosyltransferase involved in cell wall biosynthesis